MAYACPVCGEPQVDAVHLADHLAFTAIAGDDAHEAWLDETVGEWGDRSREDLAEAVVDHADETDFPIDDEELGRAEQGEHGHDHAHGGEDVQGHSGGERRPQRGPSAADAPPADTPAADAPTADDDAVEDVLAEAREYTREMQDGDGSGDDASASDDSAGDGDESAGNESAADDREPTSDGASDNETE